MERLPVNRRTGAIRLVIADDHPIVREGLKHIISQSEDVQVVGETDDGETVAELCATTRADVLLLDVSMPGPGVLELIPQLKASLAALRILVLSVHPERHYARRVLKAGADGYLMKTNSTQALASAIREVHSGRKYLSPALADELARDLSRGRERQPHETLSNREFEVFLSLGAGESVDLIARQLNVSPKTVRTYRARILEKLNLRTTAQLIFYAVRWGLVTDVADQLRRHRARSQDERRETPSRSNKKSK